jgi:hypothetical protein
VIALTEAVASIGWTAADLVWTSDTRRQALAECVGLADVDAHTWGLVADRLLA